MGAALFATTTAIEGAALTALATPTALLLLRLARPERRAALRALRRRPVLLIVVAEIAAMPIPAELLDSDYEDPAFGVLLGLLYAGVAGIVAVAIQAARR